MENKEKELKETTKYKDDANEINFASSSKDTSTSIAKRTPEQVLPNKTVDSLKTPPIASNGSSIGSHTNGIDNSSKETIKFKDGIKIDFTPSSNTTPTLVVKKTPEQILPDKIVDSPKAISAASINSSLGSFGNDAFDPSKETEQELINNQQADKKIVVKEEPITPVDINFEKFQTRQKTSFGVKVDILLRNKKSLLKV
jgi:hypothetical protein